MSSERPERNWAQNYRYTGRVVRPVTLEDAAETVAREPRIRALGSRHSFTALPDTDGVLLDMSGLPSSVSINESTATARVSAWSTYGALARELEAHGWALGTMASLPHISVGGAVATGTHGSGDTNQALSSAVSAVEYLGPDGNTRRVVRADADFAGSVVSLGALGIATAVELDIEPRYDLRQDVLVDIPWEEVDSSLDALMGAAYSVSLFTRFGREGITQAWFKSRELDHAPTVSSAARATGQRHMLAGGEAAATTPQGGVRGAWLDRLPHFRMEFTPSNGAELQSEYLIPRANALAGLRRLREIFALLDPVLQLAELRTVAADDQWLSSASGDDVLGVHFTWTLDPAAVYAVLPAVEEALLPLRARPHWGKCFVASSRELARLYPRLADFRALRDRVDPNRTFSNDFLDHTIG